MLSAICLSWDQSKILSLGNELNQLKLLPFGLESFRVDHILLFVYVESFHRDNSVIDTELC